MPGCAAGCRQSSRILTLTLRNRAASLKGPPSVQVLAELR